ncbi:MAG: sodium/glutamate symporter [Rivularia sp. (in: cyanobacteria)]
MFQLIDAFWAYILIAILILVGRFIRERIGILQSLFIPSSVVAGAIALLLGPSALGAIINTTIGSNLPLVNGIFPEAILTVWSKSPGIFINIVFATLFLGQMIPGWRTIWRQAAPQAAFGQILGWGQYVIGLILGITVLTPIFKLPAIAASLIEVAFEGGHGTSAGMADTFAELGFPEAADLSLTLATVGLVSGIIIGTWLIDWGRRTGRIQVQSQVSLLATNEDSIHSHTEENPSTKAARDRLFKDLLIDPISLNFGFVGLAVAIGWLILQVLGFIESKTWGSGDGLKLIAHVPLFPMILVGGILVQLLLIRTNRSYMVSRPLMEHIGGLALDVTIVTALASISLKALSANLVPLLILSIAGIVWNVFVYVFLAPRLIPFYPNERGLGDLGQSMGVTATGILLLRMVDPDNRTGAFECFAYKQLLFEPILGGGLFTAAAPTLIVRYGSIPVLLFTSAVLAFWLIFGIWNCNKLKKSKD